MSITSIHFVNHPRTSLPTYVSPPYPHQVYHSLLCSASSAKTPDTEAIGKRFRKIVLLTNINNIPTVFPPFPPNRVLRLNMFSNQIHPPDLVIKWQPILHTPPASLSLSPGLTQPKELAPDPLLRDIHHLSINGPAQISKQVICKRRPNEIPSVAFSKRGYETCVLII